MLQNARVLVDHLNRNLTEAARITAVSDFTETMGFIEFEDNDGNNLRYDVDANNYVQFGLIGSLSELAGPVSQFQFTCYDGNDFINPTTEVNDIRFVKAEATLTNSTVLGRDMTFAAKTYIRTNTVPCTQGLVGWWKLDETSGLTAADSSGFGNDGTLTNMTGGEWTTGPVDGGLEFDGNNDAITGIGDCPTGNFTVAGWAKDTGGSGWKVFYSARQEIWFGVDSDASPRLWCDIGGNGNGVKTPAGTWTLNTWHHIAVTWDGTTAHLYIDGVDMAITYGTPENPLALAAVIGAWSDNPSDENWFGTLDDVRLYDRALSAGEISQLVGVVYKEFTEAKTGSDTTAITLSTPGGTSQGDLLITAVATDGLTKVSLAPPGGEGWTEIYIDDRSNKVTLGAWWKLADASESPSHQFTWSGPEQAYAWMMRFTGHHPTTPINVWAGDRESSSAPTSPAVTTTVGDCLILRLGGFDDGDITVDAPGLSGHAAITMDSSGGQVSYEEFTEKKRSSNGTSLTIDTPSGTSQGNLLIAAVVTDASETISPPGGEGWTLISHESYSSDVTLGVWWKLADASESPTHQFTWGSSEKAYGWMMRFTGHHPTTPINVWGARGGSSSSPDCPSVTTTVADTMIVRIGGFDDDDITIDNPGLSGHTAITMDESGSGSDTCSGGAGYVLQAAVGASGVSEFSLTRSEQYRTVTIAIAPAPAADDVVSGGAGCVKQSSAGDSG
ncbi:MAG: LamG domain-containing protein, partial [Planctomycetota bacterium]